MLRYILRRVLFLIPVLIGVSFIVFSLLYLTPGDPARIVLGDQATEEAVQEFRNKEGLNDPFLVQYGRYVYKALHGDIGRSYMTRRPVSGEILSAFPATIRLAALQCYCYYFRSPSALSRQSGSIHFSIRSLWCLPCGPFHAGILLGILLILFFRSFEMASSSGFNTMVPRSCRQTCRPVDCHSDKDDPLKHAEVVRQDYIRTVRARGRRSRW